MCHVPFKNNFAPRVCFPLPLLAKDFCCCCCCIHSRQFSFLSLSLSLSLSFSLALSLSLFLLCSFHPLFYSLFSPSPYFPYLFFSDSLLSPLFLLYLPLFSSLFFPSPYFPFLFFPLSFFFIFPLLLLLCATSRLPGGPRPESSTPSPGYVPDGLGVFERTADEERTYTQRAKRPNSECLT